MGPPGSLAGAVIAAVILTHRFTLKREKQASQAKMVRERYFIATELVFLLDRFAGQCTRWRGTAVYRKIDTGFSASFLLC